MRLAIFSLFAFLLAVFIILPSCGQKEEQKVSTKTPEAPISGAAPTAQQGSQETESLEQEEKREGKDETLSEQPEDEGKMPWQLERANDPYGLLIDPGDTSQNMSYWRDAKVGDWVRFINHVGAIVLFTVLERDGNNLSFEAKLFSGDGKEISMDKKGAVIPKTPDTPPDIRPVDIEKDDAEARLILNTNPFIKMRNIVDWKVFMSDKSIHCEHRFTEKPGWTNETLSSREVKAGGYVFARSNNDTYVVLLDWGDKDNLPKWDTWTTDDLKKWRFRWGRFLHQEFVENEDPQQPEPPEKAEDPPSEAIVLLMSKVATIFAQKIATPIEKDGDLIETAKEIENLLPLLKQLEELHAKERFGYGTEHAQALTNEVLNLKNSLSGADPSTAKDFLARARSAYENLRIATRSEAKW